MISSVHPGFIFSHPDLSTLNSLYLFMLEHNLHYQYKYVMVLGNNPILLGQLKMISQAVSVFMLF